jgi:NitT/TauT family transport system permease protein
MEPDLRRRILHSARAGAPSALLMFGLLVGWLVATEIVGVSRYLLPSLWDVLDRLYDGLVRGTMYRHIRATVVAALLGYLGGGIVAFALGVLVAEFRVAERYLYPLLLLFQATPKVAIAPLIFIWVGFGVESTIVLVMLIVLFPIFTNTIVGLRSTNPDLVDMYRAFSASRWMILWNAKLPSAAGQIFVGLQISVLFALTGCVVMEFITGVRGMGFLIENSAGTLNIPLIFASLVVLAALGITASKIVRMLHHAVVFWERPRLREADSEGSSG